MFDLYDEKKFSFFRKKAKYCSEVFFLEKIYVQITLK